MSLNASSSIIHSYLSWHFNVTGTLTICRTRLYNCKNCDLYNTDTFQKFWRYTDLPRLLCPLPLLLPPPPLPRPCYGPAQPHRSRHWARHRSRRSPHSRLRSRCLWTRLHCCRKIKHGHASSCVKRKTLVIPLTLRGLSRRFVLIQTRKFLHKPVKN